MTKIPLDRVLFGVNPPAGMDLAVIGHWSMLMRKTAEPVDPPILVSRELIEVFRVADGRHRVIGAIVGGRTHIHGEVIDTPSLPPLIR